MPVEDELVSVGEDEGGWCLRWRFAGGASSKMLAIFESGGELEGVSALVSLARSSADR